MYLSVSRILDESLNTNWWFISFQIVDIWEHFQEWLKFEDISKGLRGDVYVNLTYQEIELVFKVILLNIEPFLKIDASY